MEEESPFMVTVRIRPLTKKETVTGAQVIARKVTDRTVAINAPDTQTWALRNGRKSDRVFQFYKTFGPDSTQKEIYDFTTRKLIDNVMDGYNATIFAYGATGHNVPGAGKTYTMVGTTERPGVMARSLDQLFREAQLKGSGMLRMSYLEIYNENIRDLLNPNSTFLDIREDPRGAVQVYGLHEVHASSSRELLEYLIQGNRRRTQESTLSNIVSSRSHAILQLATMESETEGTIADWGKLIMIDLAGSERSGFYNTGQRLKEGTYINKSLLALSNVINSLSRKTVRHVNYRDSKLTRLLKDSIGGNSITVMIATVSPASKHFEETRNTLMYAQRAMSITNKVIPAERFQISQAEAALEYQTLIADLRDEVGRLRRQLATPTGPRTEPIDRALQQENLTEEQEEELRKLKRELLKAYQDRVLLRRRLASRVVSKVDRPAIEDDNDTVRVTPVSSRRSRMPVAARPIVLPFEYDDSDMDGVADIIDSDYKALQTKARIPIEDFDYVFRPAPPLLIPNLLRRPSWSSDDEDSDSMHHTPVRPRWRSLDKFEFSEPLPYSARKASPVFLRRYWKPMRVPFL